MNDCSQPCPRPWAAVFGVLALALASFAATPVAAQNDAKTIITFGPKRTMDRNVATFAFVADPTATDPTVADPTVGDPTGLRYSCSLDGSPALPCVSPVTYGNLEDGAHRFTVQAFTADGVAFSPAHRKWSIDTSALTRITSGPTGKLASPIAVFEFVSRSGEARFACSLDGGRLTPCTSPQTYRGLANGRHSFAVASVDASGMPDSPPAEWTFVVAVPEVDLCPETPRGASEVYQGCSAQEVASFPHLVTGPALTALDGARARLTGDAFREVAAGIARAATLVRQAGEQMEHAEVCSAAATARSAAAELVASEGTMAAVAAAVLAELPPDALDADDATDGSRAVAQLRLAEKLLADDSAAVRAALAGFDAACASVIGPVAGRGVVAATDDAARLVTLDSGRSIVVSKAVREPALVRGAEVSYEGLLLAEGTAVVTQVVGATASYDGLELACMDLRIAPVQPLPPYAATPLVLHRPKAYEVEGRLQLEQRMGLAAVELGCPGATADGQALHYSMSLELVQPGKAGMIAFELHDGERVPVPALLAPETPVQIVARVQRTECHPTIPLACKPPEIIRQATYEAFIRPLGSYASATYARTVFGVTDNGVPNDFETTEVVGFALADDVAQGAIDTSFAASGWAVQGTNPPSPAAIGLDQPFAVFEHDGFDPAEWFLGAPESELGPASFPQTGQTRPSALRWGRVAGKRNGWTFWYYASLPGLIRDRVAECSTSPAFTLPTGDALTCGNKFKQVPTMPFGVQEVKDTFYKLPFDYGFVPGHGNMNIDDEKQCRRHGDSQAYALDLGAAFETTLRAARGGRVVTVAENEPDKIPVPGGDPLCGGNFMWIRHQDGTFAVYFHMVEDGVDVDEGAYVKRGQAVARVGSTGCSGGPHVHFSVHSEESVTLGAIADWNVLRARYQIAVPLWFNGKSFDLAVGCYIPRAGEFAASSNFAP
jgi:hypothetical protein